MKALGHSLCPMHWHKVNQYIITYNHSRKLKNLEDLAKKVLYLLSQNSMFINFNPPLIVENPPLIESGVTQDELNFFLL